MKRIENYAITACLALIGCLCLTGCADSLEEMKKENYEANWIKKFGKVDPNHTWNIATPTEANLSIKEDALTEYTFKIYDNDPIWGTDAKLLAKAVVKTDGEGYAQTHMKFDAPAGLEKVYITRTDSHGRRLLKVSNIENKTMKVEFGIFQDGSRADEGYDFPVFNLPDYIANLNSIKEEAANLEDGLKNNNNNSTIDFNQSSNRTVKVTTDKFTISGINFNTQSNAYGNYKLIIDANCTWNTTEKNQIYGVDVIITPGHTLTITGSILDVQCYTRLIVMEGAKFVAFGGNGTDNNSASIKMQWDDTPLVYNAGTIQTNYISMNSGHLYNTSTGIIESNIIQFLQDNTGTLTNYGKVHVESIYGNGRTENIGAVQSGQHGTINNACFINVDMEFNIFNLNLAANSSIESKYIIVNNMILRPSCILRSDEFSAQNASWKFVGDKETGRALISTKHTSYLHSGGIHIDGPIYYESNTFANETYKTAIEIAASNGLGCGVVGSAPFLIIPDGFDANDISKADCVGHGNIPQDFENIVDTSIEWVVAFEDLGSTGDYDFNDAVVGITHNAETNQVEITPLAAGGTMKAELYFGNEKLGEIHDLLRKGAPTNVPINVDERGNKGQKIIKSVGNGFSISEKWQDLKIVVGNKSSTIVLEPNKETGRAPQAICIPAPWFWAKEGIHIEQAYKQFGGWTQDQNSNQKWHQTPERGKIAL
ncbi:MAG: DUF4842 domain-containing protein [Bacteroidaceae bacterium]|nr:DUF4842 domain-containing protein [Bacteroidaceae bacterium]